jgi:predicted MFS family arabinose efflux permease
MKVVAVYIAGEAIGSILQIIAGDKLGRKRFMQLACILVTVGVVIQTAATNVGMLLAGRVLAGIAVG